MLAFSAVLALPIIATSYFIIGIDLFVALVKFACE